jgi:hypothetical protein
VGIMASYKPSAPPKPISISRWLGVNESVSQSEVNPGEAIRQVDWRITKDYKPQKRPGHNTFVDFGNALNVQGMWTGTLAGVETLIACNNGHAYRDKSISGTVYDSLVTSYTYVDVIKTTALVSAEAGSTGVDNVVILYNSSRVKMTEVAAANIDLVASVGKFYFDADEKLNYIVAKGAYATIAAARTGLGTTTAYYRIGALTDAKTSIFYFESKLYFLNGTDYKEYDGTTFQDVVPYESTLYTGLAPDLTGFDETNIYEDRNLINVIQNAQYTGNGTATVYKLPDTTLDAALVTCTVNGVAKVETTDFTVNRTASPNATVTFTVAPASGSLVILHWSKTISGNSDLVKKNRFAMTFGPGNDTAVFLWGNSTYKNRRIWSGTLKANYFPSLNFTQIGSNEYAITDIKSQNANYQIIFKEDRTHYSYADSTFLATTGKYDYPVYDLNEKVGNVAFGGAQIVQNNPVSIKGAQWWLWTTTSMENDRNADPISSRLKNSLSAIDLTTAITFDYESEQEYWCNVGSTVYIWNYGNNTMYTYSNISATCFLDIDGVIYYGSQGTIQRFDGVNDNGVAVVPQLDTGANSFGGINYIKSSDTLYIGLLPYSFTSVNIYYKTNKINEWKKLKKKAFYYLLDWNYIDFNKYTFKTNRNQQTFTINFSSGDYTTIQFRIENDGLNEACTLIDFIVNAEIQGEV